MIRVFMVFLASGFVLAAASMAPEKLQALNSTFWHLEKMFEAQDKEQCIESLFCQMEAEINMPGNHPLTYYSRVLTNSKQDFDDVAFASLRKLIKAFPRLFMLTKSINLGKETNNATVCIETFPTCKPPGLEEIRVHLGLVNAKVMRRSVAGMAERSCAKDSLRCGAVGGGCLLCDVATEGHCIFICADHAASACSKVGCLFG